jgi:hypothetical protein
MSDKFIDDDNKEFLDFFDDNRSLLEREFLDIYQMEFYDYAVKEFMNYKRVMGNGKNN